MTDQQQTTNAAENFAQANSGPIQTLRDGAVVVKLWLQESKNGPFVTATLGRTYQDRQSGEYRESRSLGGTDLLKAQALLGEANREMIQWREYYKAQKAQEQQAQQQQPDGQKGSGQPSATASSDLTAARDAALGNARTQTNPHGQVNAGPAPAPIRE